MVCVGFDGIMEYLGVSRDSQLMLIDTHGFVAEHYLLPLLTTVVTLPAD